MLHKQIEDEEIIERYVSGQSSPQDRRAFEEHFFACDECFEKLRKMEEFVAGVKDAAEHGILAAPRETAAPSSTATWLTWAFAASACASVVLALAVGWLALSTVPRLKARLNATSADVELQRQMIARLQETPNPAQEPEANVPLVMLQASRGGEVAEAVLPTGAKRLVLWVEIGATRYRSYRMEIFSESGKPVAALDNLTRGPYGALAASLPAEQLPSGVFRVTLTGQSPPTTSLVGEYRLRIRKPLD